jgi:hypothetical protein
MLDRQLDGRKSWGSGIEISENANLDGLRHLPNSTGRTCAHW